MVQILKLNRPIGELGQFPHGYFGQPDVEIGPVVQKTVRRDCRLYFGFELIDCEQTLNAAAKVGAGGTAIFRYTACRLSNFTNASGGLVLLFS